MNSQPECIQSSAGEATLTEGYEPVKGTRSLRVGVWIGVGILTAGATVTGEVVTLDNFILEIGANRFPVGDTEVSRLAVATPKGCRPACQILAARALEDATA